MNKQLIFSKRPVGMAQADTWTLKNSPIPELNKGEILIKTHYVSLDPAMRGWMNDQKSYIPPIQIGEVMRAGIIGEVTESDNPKFMAGDVVTGWDGVQQYTTTTGQGFYKVDTKLASMPTYIGTLGMPGMTGYFGVLGVGKIKEGDTVLISGAAGAVGGVAGQIAKIKGCTVIGIAGGSEKCRHLVEDLGFDAAIDYKNENIYKGIKKYCPKGIDVYFDNVGGEILDAALANLRMHARGGHLWSNISIQ